MMQKHLVYNVELGHSHHIWQCKVSFETKVGGSTGWHNEDNDPAAFPQHTANNWPR